MYVLPCMLLPVFAPVANAAIILTEGIAYTQNFNTLISTGTKDISLETEDDITIPAGWTFSESSTNANTIYTAGTGSGSGGDTYSLGASGSTDRAFGMLRSGNLVSTIGASFSYAEGGSVSLAISYKGEQWRVGTANRTDSLTFQISTDATSLTTGTWTTVSSLSYTAASVATTGAKDGNHADFSQAISGSTVVALGEEGTFWIRWFDVDASGADDALAIDDFSITLTSVPEPAAAVLGALGFLGIFRRRR